MTKERDDSRATVPSPSAEKDAPAAAEQDAVQGEGNYDASRQYNEATREFVASGQVDAAAREAAPADAGEAAELLQAEEAGKARAKEEDPAVDRGDSRCE